MEELIKELEEKAAGIEGLDLGDTLLKIQTAYNSIANEKNKVNEKNKELLGKQKKLKEELQETESMKEDYERLKQEEEERLSNPDPTKNVDVQVELEKLQEKLNRKHQTEIDKLNKVIESKDSIIQTQDNEINGSLVRKTISEQLANGTPVMETHIDLLKGYFANYAEVIINDDDKKEVVLRDASGNAPEYLKDENGKIKAEEFFSWWKGVDKNKTYLQAPITNGGGAKPGTKSTKTYSRLSEVPFSERLRLKSEKPSEYERLRRADQ